ncbi:MULTISPECIES: hypothetical protein [Pseudomonas]|uniref:Uncharacterized protein n=1 Tax=Pseudomonas wuhanensis TaxID=2954098 RepID=A0ABY9GLE1_9PSED|nr:MULTISPECIES: hypothetical protein [unclassified Pseudomonas]WLI10769.1 hypothetical protein PSH65_21605 [Pseudomonas sp. FP603]WLI16590.1 hypothetical protein PSH88_20235 [Pseudomonas sp. FP607]
MRPLSPCSAAHASDCFQLGFDPQATTDSLNQARPFQLPYQVDDIRHFQQNGARQGWSQQNNAPIVPAPASSSVSHAPAPMSLLQRIAPLEGERYSLANMDGSVARRIDELKAQYSPHELTRALIEQRNPQDFSGASLPSGHSVDSRTTGSTQDSRYSDASGQPPPARLPAPQEQ